MKHIYVKDYTEMSMCAADIYEQQALYKPDSVMCCPTGSTPIGMYNELARRRYAKSLTFDYIHAFNMDEYVGLDERNKNSFNYFLDQHLYWPLGIREEQVHRLKLKSGSEMEKLDAYDREIKEYGNLDLLVLGLGADGHIAFNMPGQLFHAGSHIEQLSDITIVDNARFFESEALVPRCAVTIGMQAVLNAAKVVLLISGKSKKQAYRQLIAHKVADPRLPASILWLHQDVTVIVDASAREDCL